jgi:NDP-sugar pyrophosphorylase family protein
MAGLGSRFKNVGIDTPKPLIEVEGKKIVEHAIASLGIKGRYIFITKKYDNEEYNKDLTRILKELVPDCIEIQVNREQYGAADACLYAEDYIDNEFPLIITNCDQLLRWDPEDFLNQIEDNNPDGAISIFKSSDSKNSFAIISNGRVSELAEKVVISEDALMGIHYWKHGKDFVASAKKLLTEYKTIGLKECYISNTYNYLIKDGFYIMPFYMKKNSFIPLGTPEDVEIYKAKVKEFYTEKPKTIFCDIDGTIIKHAHRFSHIGKTDPVELDGVIDKFNDWDSKGHKIILTTARKESARYITEKHLSDLGFCWDYLLMGMTSGTRLLINDKLQDIDSDRAVAINLITDSGFKDVEWGNYGL